MTITTTIFNSAQWYNESYSRLSSLGPFDVLCGRDKTCSSNAGNRRFRLLINEYLSIYSGCDSRFLRIIAIKTIAEDIQSNSRGSIRFFKRINTGSDNDENDDFFVELLDEKQSQKKGAQALRDCALLQKRRKKPRKKKYTPRAVSDSSSSSNHHCDKNTQQNTSSTHHVGGHHHPVSPKISELLNEEAKLTAEIESLQQSMDALSQARIGIPSKEDAGSRIQNNFATSTT